MSERHPTVIPMIAYQNGPLAVRSPALLDFASALACLRRMGASAMVRWKRATV